MKRLSVGAKWTLRFSMALLVAVSLFSLYTFHRIEQNIIEDAKLLLDLQLRQLADADKSPSLDPHSLLESMERSVAVAQPDLKLGLQVFDANGELLLAKGSLDRYELGLPANAIAEQRRVAREIDVGEAYSFLVIALPSQNGYVQGALYMRRFVRNARAVRDIYLWAMPLATVLTVALGFLLARGSLKPIAAISKAARRISGTHLDEELPTTGSGDELDELATTLNDMMGRIRSSVERMQRFSANAAHELRTPLSALRSRLDVTLEQDRSAAEYRKILEEISDEVDGLSEAAHAMMRLAQSEAGLSPEQRQPVDLSALIREAVEFFEPLAADEGIALEVVRLDEAATSGDAAWLHQLFANLLDNAIRYTDSGGRIEVEVARDEDEDEPGRVRVSVADNGIGLEAAELERIFEPYHRVRSGPPRSSTGVGLGLPLALEIARAHGGEIRVQSRPGEGSTFTVLLPIG